MDGNGFGPHIMDEGFIDRKGGAGIDDLISWITVSLLAKADGRLGPGKDNDSIRRRLNPPCLAQMLCDGLAEGQESPAGRSSAYCLDQSAS